MRFERNPFLDSHSVFFKALNLLRVIGEKADRGNPKVLKDASPNRVITLVGTVPKHQISLDRVVSLIL
jgi:hypothetical protein